MLVPTLLLTGSCKQTSNALPRRTAVLRFENLGAPAADWQGRALSELLKRSFDAYRLPRASSGAPGVSTERLASLEAGATRLITGFYTASGGHLQVTAYAEDVATQKQEGPVHVTGTLAEICGALAREFQARQPAACAPSPGLQEYALAADTAGAAAVPHYRAAIAADPNFGAAYLGLAQADPANAREALLLAAPHTAGFTREERAYLQLQSAADNRERAAALSAIAALGLPDAETLNALATAEMSIRKPAEAARHYRQAAALAPADPNLRNLLTYALLFAGDEAGARAEAGEYRKLRPADPNVFDTQGDVEFAFGRFSAAEKTYLATPDLNFQDKLPTWKAAQARLLAGDSAGATALVERGRLNPYRRAEWLYITGKHPDAIATMVQLGAASTGDARSAAYTQAAIWALAGEDKPHAIEYSNLALHPASPSTFLLAAVARDLAQPDASVAEWTRRADSDFSGVNAAQVRRFALGYALLLSKHYAEALPIWKELYESTAANDQSTQRFYALALRRTGHGAEAAALLRLQVIPASGNTPSFDALYESGLRQ